MTNHFVTMTNTNPCDDRPRIGLLAAWGRYPLAVAKALREDGFHTCCLGVKDYADPALAQLCDDFAWVGVARCGAAVRWFKRHHVQQATMAGKLHKVGLFQRRAWLRNLPDWTTLKAFYPHFVSGATDRKDDTLLLTVVDTFAQHGIEFLPATDFAPELLVKPGCLAGGSLSLTEQADVEFGWEVAKQLGAIDIGQSVCVKGRAVLAVEAIEGTDHCIARAGQLCPQGGFTVVKVAKPQQDMRFDVPTVGVGTLETMSRSGAKVLAVEGENTILLESADFCAFAAQQHLKVIAIGDPPRRLRAAS
ncbi:MAG: LpxI family protein [Aeoliella sp.]